MFMESSVLAVTYRRRNLELLLRQLEFLLAVVKGRTAACEGRLIDDDDVAARMDRRYRR